MHHFVHFYNSIGNYKIIFEQVDELLKYVDKPMLHPDMKASIHQAVGLVKFSTGQRTYLEVKEHLKKAILLAHSPKLKSQIAANLSVINYSEVIDHNDHRVEVGNNELREYLESRSSMEAIEKQDMQKFEERKKEI